jgi:mercuric ion transport protein
LLGSDRALSEKHAIDEQCETCETPFDGRTRGWVYAVLTAIACPCHLPVVGIVLGGSAAGALFYQHFLTIATFMGLLTLYFFVRAVRILL